MNRTIAMTGATGFAGGHAVAALLARGHRVRALVRNPAAATLPEAVARVQGDLDSAEALARLVSGADAVVHLAGAITALSADDYHRVNAGGTSAIAAAAARAGVARFVHVSSLSARAPDVSAYAASKRAGEDAAAGAPDAVILRPPAVYGPGDRATLPLIRAMTQPVAAIPGRRDARFSLIHARDLARIIVHAAEGEGSGIHEVSDGTPGGYGWADLLAAASAERGGPIRAVFLPRALPEAVAMAAEAVARLRGRAGMINRGKISELYQPDWVCGDSALNLADSLRFAAGLADTLAWYREAGWLPRSASADRRAGNDART